MLRPAIHTRRDTTAERINSALCPAGMPRLDPLLLLGAFDTVVRDGYALVHSPIDKIPLFVCEHVKASELGGGLARDDKFRPDPMLPAGRRAELRDYAGSGYDRGHMAPAGDETRSEKRKAETFYLSNMAPQVPDNNRQLWRTIEETVRGWIQKRGEAFVITGPIFHDPAEEDPKTADGLVPYEVIGPGAVAVPTHFFKIVAIAQADQWEVIALVVENRAYARPFELSKLIRSVDWIEARTGIDFMPDLDKALAEKIESQEPALWE